MTGTMRDFYSTICGENKSALEWICLFHDYMHEVDDIIDENDWNPERVMKCLIMANDVYSHSFYLEHWKRLQCSILSATSVYCDSIKWERSTDLWKRQFAEVTRHAGNEVVHVVALICGGYENVRKISAAMLAAAFIYHKDKYGVPQ